MATPPVAESRRPATPPPPILGTPAGHRRCRRWARPDRPHLPAARRAGSSQRTLVARPGHVRLVERHGDPVEAAPALTEPACLRALGEPVGDDLGEVLGGR